MHKIEARFELSMLENPFNNLLFDHIEGSEFFLIFLVSNFELSSPTSGGTTAEFLALYSSHNRPRSEPFFLEYNLLIVIYELCYTASICMLAV